MEKSNIALILEGMELPIPEMKKFLKNNRTSLIDLEKEYGIIGIVYVYKNKKYEWNVYLGVKNVYVGITIHIIARLCDFKKGGKYAGEKINSVFEEYDFSEDDWVVKYLSVISCIGKTKQEFSSELNELEKKAIKEYDSFWNGLNKTKGGGHNCDRKKHKPSIIIPYPKDFKALPAPKTTVYSINRRDFQILKYRISKDWYQYIDYKRFEAMFFKKEVSRTDFSDKDLQLDFYNSLTLRRPMKGTDIWNLQESDIKNIYYIAQDPLKWHKYNSDYYEATPGKFSSWYGTRNIKCLKIIEQDEKCKITVYDSIKSASHESYYSYPSIYNFVKNEQDGYITVESFRKRFFEDNFNI